MAEGFVGRRRELALLRAELAAVGADPAAPGRAVLLRGRRRVGKSRLLEEVARASGVPAVVHQCARNSPPDRALAAIAHAVATSDLPDASIAADNRPGTLVAALTLLAAALPDDRPSLVVLDDVPWLLAAVEGAGGMLRRAWDRALSRKPVLLVLAGADLGAMEALAAPGGPFEGRAAELLLEPLGPREVAEVTGADAVTAVDAALVTGGLPLVVAEWRPGDTATAFLRRSFASPLSALVATGPRALDPELTPLARDVLAAVARGAGTFTAIQQACGGSGGLKAASLSRVLSALVAARAVAQDLPLSTADARHPRYRVADPGLAFWLRFVEPALPEIDRGRADLAAARVARDWATWRDAAVLPLVRDAVGRLLADDGAQVVGGWWPRSGSPAVDLVAADARPAGRVGAVGVVAWRTDRPLGPGDVDALARDAVAVPGVTAATPLVGVCPAGADDPRLAHAWTADDLLAALP